MARSLGIGIHKNVEFTDPKSLILLYPQLKVVVGADGSQSNVRKTIFRDELNVKSDLKFIVEVKYEVQGNTRPLSFIKGVYPTLKAMRSIAQEHIGREKDGKTPVTLRLFVDRHKYEEMQTASFRHPYSFANEDRINSHVRNNIHLWLNLKTLCGENRIKGSEKITVTRLGIYSSKHVVKKAMGVTWCLVGDAAFGVPFFQGIKNGFLSGTELSKRIVQAIHPKNGYRDKLLSKISRNGPFFAVLHGVCKKSR